MARITHQVHHHDLHDEQVNLPATPAAPQAAAAASNGGGTGAGAGADAGTAAATAPTAADLFNDATTRMVGGIGPDQVDKIVADLTAVQQMLTAASPQINNLSDLHTHIIIEQLNEEIASVQGTTSATGTPILGTDLGQFVGRSINDIHRDIIDIAQGDAGVQAIFNPTPLPDLATSPVPFHDNAEQTAFLTQFIQDSSHLGQMATTIAKHGFHGDIAGLLQQKPSRPMPVPSTNPRAACTRRASGTSCGRTAPRARRRMR
jgi:trimeric autotransporter adhesin